MNKILIISAAVVLLALVLGIGGWQYVKGTPQYSLYQFYQAAADRDYEAASKYFDIESVASNIVDRAVEESFGDEENLSEGEALGNSLAEGFLFALKPRLNEEFKNQFRKQIENGEFISNEEKRGFIEIFRKTKVERDGKVATVTITAADGEERTFKAREQDRYWQIFDLEYDLENLDTDEGDQAAEQQESTQRVAFGTRADITKGWFLTVGAPEPFEPTDPFSQPAEGKKFVTFEVVYENTTSEKDSLDTDRLKLKDNEDHAYTPEWLDGKEPELKSGDLEGGGTVKGYVTYELPIELDPKEIVYSSSQATVVFENQQ